MNEWPDPQFCVQDADQFVASMNNELAGTLGPLSISGCNVGSLNITFDCASTGELEVNDMIRFSDVGNDPALPRALKSRTEDQIFRVVRVDPDVSFSGTLEYTTGSPTHSAAVIGHFTQRGITSSSGSGDVTSNVKRGNPKTTVWISERSAHVSRLRGCRRVLIVQKGTAGEETIHIAADETILPTLANVSKAIGFAVVVVSGQGAGAQPFYNDGSAGSPHALGPTATAGTRTWVSNVAAIQPDPTVFQIGVQLNGPVGSTFILGEFTYAASTARLADGAFSTPMGQSIRVLASVSPWIGATFTMPDSDGPHGFAIDMNQASGGTINEGVAWFSAQLEGQATTSFFNLAFDDSPTAPTIFNPILTSIHLQGTRETLITMHTPRGIFISTATRDVGAMGACRRSGPICLST